METFAVHKVDDNLVVSITKLPGFGKLGTATVCLGDKTKQYIELYYAGGFFKRNPDDAVMKKVTDQVVTIAQNYVNRRKIPGRVISVSFTSVLRPVKEHEHQI
jgi:hypothetical protein